MNERVHQLKKDRNKIQPGDQDIALFAEKLSVSAEDVEDAIKKTGSQDRKLLEDYLHQQKNRKRD